jgi:hypothetical protein
VRAVEVGENDGCRGAREENYGGSSSCIKEDQTNGSLIAPVLLLSYRLISVRVPRRVGPGPGPVPSPMFS